MYKALKKVLYLSIVFVLLLSALVYGLLNINGLIEKNREYIVSQVENSIDREVSVGSIRLNLFGGLGLNLSGLQIKDDPNFHSGNFIETDELIVNVKLLPLISKDIQVKKIILKTPLIRIIKDSSGNFNFSGLAKSEQDSQEKPQSESGVKDFKISVVDISDGVVQYLDLKDGNAVLIENLDLALSNIGLDDKIGVDLALALYDKEQNILINGTVGPVGRELNTDNLPVDLSLDLKSLKLSELNKNISQLRDALPPEVRHVDSLTLKTQANGTMSALKLAGLELNAGMFGAKDANLKISGDIEPVGAAVDTSDMRLALDIDLGPVKSEQLFTLQSIKDSIPPELNMTGPLSFKGRVEGTPTDIKIKDAVLSATDSSVVYASSFNKPRGTDLVLKTDANLVGDNLNLTNTNLKLAGLVFDISGKYNLKDSTADISVNSNDADLAELSKIINEISPYKLSGTIQTSAKIKGQMADGKIPNINGSLKLAGINASPQQLAKPINDLNSEIKFTGNSAKLDKTDLTIGSSKVSIAAEAVSFTPLSVSYFITSPRIHMADITPENKTDETLDEVTVTGKVYEQVGSMIHEATVKSRSGKLSSLSYNNLNGKLSLKDDVVTIDELALNVLSAVIRTSGTYNMASPKPAFDLKSSIQGLSITNLVQSISRSNSDHIRGKSDLVINLSGTGNTWEEIKPTLTGLTRIDLTEGEIVDFNVAEEVLTGITGVNGLSGLLSSSLKTKYPHIFQNKSTVFYDLKSVLKISGGKMNFNDLILKATDYFVNGDGWVSLDKGLNVNGVLNLSEQFSNDLVSNAQFIKYLKNDKNEIEIPFNISGLLPNVSPKPDMSYVAKSLQGAAIDRGKEEIQKRVIDKILPKTDDPNSETTEDSKAPASKNIEEELIQKGLDKVLDF